MLGTSRPRWLRAEGAGPRGASRPVLWPLLAQARRPNLQLVGGRYMCLPETHSGIREHNLMSLHLRYLRGRTQEVQ